MPNEFHWKVVLLGSKLTDTLEGSPFDIELLEDQSDMADMETSHKNFLKIRRTNDYVIVN